MGSSLNNSSRQCALESSQQSAGRPATVIDDNDVVLIGRVIKPHGVRGEVVVDATTDDPFGRFAVGEVLCGKQAGKDTTVTVAAMRPHQGRLLVRFEEIGDRNAAETVRGMRFLRRRFGIRRGGGGIGMWGW